MPTAETLAQKIIEFNHNLHYHGELPPDFRVLNPYHSNPETMVVMSQFYEKYYNDTSPRRFLIGINPSRNGAGVTGVPFTDTKRLESVCGIHMETAYTHEISSVFIYDMIEAYGGADAFYQDFYINSPFPLAIIRKSPEGNWLNANYYDDPQLFKLTRDFMIESLENHIGLGLDTSEVFVLGKKNAEFLKKINRDKPLFSRMTVLDHPRYIQQYQSKNKLRYIQEYLRKFNGL